MLTFLNNFPKKLFNQTNDYDSLTKLEIVEMGLQIKHKNINYRHFKETFSNFYLKNTKLLPICIEIVKTFHDLMPLHVSPQNKRRKFRKTISSKISVISMEEAMDFECILFDDFEENLLIDFVIKGNIFNQELIDITEFNESFKKNICNKSDFMKLSKTHIYNLPNHMKQQLINIFNKMIWGNNSVQIKEHSIGISYLIYKESKKGSFEDINSYRIITTIPNIVNYFHRILAIRFTQYFIEQRKIVDTLIHKGSIPNIKYAVLEQIIKVKNAIRLSNENNKEIHIMFIDISNAFPSVNIKKMLTLLFKYGVDDKILNYIDIYYESFEYKTFVSKGNSTNLKPWKQGLIQGCPLSPILFVIIMNYITNILTKKYLQKYGFDFMGIPIMFTAFLDDICIITNSYEGIEHIFNDMKELFEIFNLKINLDKTKIMSHYSGERNGSLKHIEQVKKIIYLGETIELDSSLKEGYKNVFKSLIRKLYYINKASYSNEKKLEVFHQYVLPWFQRKLMSYYDFEITKKRNLRKITYYFLNKWGSKENITFQNPLDVLMKTSNDDYVKKILEDPFTKNVDEETMQLEEKGRTCILKYKFRY